MVKKKGSIVRLSLFLLVSLAMLAAGPAIAGDLGQTATEKGKGFVCMNVDHTASNGKCVDKKNISRSQGDINEGPHLDLDMEDDES